MMCAATVNWTLFTDIPSPAPYVMLNSTIGYIFFCMKSLKALKPIGLLRHRTCCAFRSRLRQRGTLMTKEQGFVCADHIDLDPFVGSRTRERALNTAIVQANI